MHIGLCCPELSGHLNPMTTLGRALAARGHRVTVVARPDAEPKTRASGLGFAAVGAAEFPAGMIAAQARTLGELTAGRALRSTIEMLRIAAETTLRDLPEVIRGEGIDAIVVDQVNPAAGTTAEVLGLPFVKACNALAINRDPGCPPAVLPSRYRPGPFGRARNQLGNWLIHRLTAPVRNAFNAHPVLHGLAPRSSEDSPAHLAEIAQQPAFCDFPRHRADPRLHLTGPWHGPRPADVPFPWDRLDGRPLIYASLGTLQNRLAGMFATIAEAVAARCPGDPIVVPVAPQLALLERASLVITHAGLNKGAGVARPAAGERDCLHRRRGARGRHRGAGVPHECPGDQRPWMTRSPAGRAPGPTACYGAGPPVFRRRVAGACPRPVGHRDRGLHALTLPGRCRGPLRIRPMIVGRTHHR